MIKLDWKDILLHCAHAAPVGIAAGIMAALGRQQGGWFQPVSFVLASAMLACEIVFWVLREKSQHGGKLGGVQSKWEAFVPVPVCLGLFIVSEVITEKLL